MDTEYFWSRAFARLGLDDEAARTALVELADIRRIEAGQTLIAQADADDELYLLLEGRVRVVLFTAQGQEVWIDSLAPGAIIGEIAALTEQTRTTGIIADTLSVIAAFPSSGFKLLLSRYGAIGAALSTLLARRVQSTTQRMFELSALSARGRVYAELLRLADARADQGMLSISPLPNLAALAKRVSTSRETVSRVIADLEKRGLLHRTDTGFLLIDPDQLDGSQS